MLASAGSVTEPSLNRPAAAAGRRVRRQRTRRRRLALAFGVLAVLVAALVSALGGAGLPAVPRSGPGRSVRAGNPFGYSPAHASQFVARATAGSAHVLFAKSPDGVIATAARVAAYRPLVDQVTAGTGIDPNLLEGLVFVESAGRPQIIAGSDPADAAGLTQILAETGQSLLGMNIELARSRQLTAEIEHVIANGGSYATLARLLARRVAVDDRFDPRRELAATVRYLKLAQRQFGRADLAIVAYHMGIGNLQHVLDDYDRGRPVPYPQLYFDTAPTRHATAYDLLNGLGDDSSLYYWRVLGAVQVMRLYRDERGALARLARLQTAGDSAAEVLHPPDLTPGFSDPTTLDQAYQDGRVLPLPDDPARLGLAYSPQLGASAKRVGAPAALYRGLRPTALAVLIGMAHDVRAGSGGSAPLTVAGAVSDARYQQAIGVSDPPAGTGYAFALARRYVSHRQAVTLQNLLDRLQALNLIAWAREPTTIDVTVASDAAGVIADGRQP
jgi:hypothetical protein